LIGIFNLVSILKPGHLGNYDSFIEKYGNHRKKIKEDAYLKQLVQKVMVRNTRKDTNFSDTKRNIETVWITFSDEEKKVYTALENSVQAFTSFSKITYLRELCSSREACYLSLKKWEEHTGENEHITEIISQIEQLPQHAKAEKTV